MLFRSIAEHPSIDEKHEGKDYALQVLVDALQAPIKNTGNHVVLNKNNLVKQAKQAANTASHFAKDENGKSISGNPVRRHEYARSWPVDHVARYLASVEFAQREKILKKRVGG